MKANERQLLPGKGLTYFLIEETAIIEQIKGTYADKCPNEDVGCIFQERET